ncbi:MAG: transketolase family protein [Candidatus Omnitrophica bacterium]|nr:transketolase family protein [Candidatus Omnitrophota bacterium]
MEELKHKPTRDGAGEAMLELGKRNKNVVVLSADLTDSTRAGWFKKEFPDRFIGFGVAEQDMLGAAAGLALCGKIPFACTFGVFASGRAWDQVRVSVAYMNLNVKIIGTHGGITVGEDGATHQALDEIALMRILPNMTVIVPSDANEAYKATMQSADIDGPVYIRLGRNPAPILTKKEEPFKIGKGVLYSEGSDISIITCGHSLYEAKKAREELLKEGIKARIINLHTPKPLDKEIILKAAQETGAFVTVEEHTVHGGMGSAIAELTTGECPVPIKMVGIRDTFGESGEPLELLKYFNLATEDVVKAAHEALQLKKK